MSVTGLHNTSSLYSNQQLQKHTANASEALASLASGKRSIKASQDPASQAIASLISSTVSVLNQAKIGANNAIGLIQVATGGLDNIKDNITQMTTLAAQAQDGSLDRTALAIINSQFSQLSAQIDDIAARARWNGSSLLNGGMPTLTVAPNATQAATGLTATTNAFAGTLNATSKGFITGTATNVSVSASGSNYNVTVTVGGQTFANTSASPVAGGQLVLTSTTDSGSTIKLDYDSTAVTGITNATTFQSTLATTLGIGGTPASFTSTGTAYNNGLAGLTVGSTTAPGQYGIRYDANSNNLVLNDGQQEWSQAVTTTGVPQNITFNNGVVASLGSTFSTATAVNQVIFNVAPNPGNMVNLTFQTGQYASDTLAVSITGATRASLNLTGINVSTPTNAATAGTLLNTALNTVSVSYALLGAQQSRLESSIVNIDTETQNLIASQANFEDADVAEEMTKYTQASTMATIASSALAHSNQLTQQLAQIVRG